MLTKLFVVVETVTGLATQAVFLDHLLIDFEHIGLNTGLLVAGLHQSVAQIHTGQVLHAEITHLMVEALFQSDIYFLRSAEAMLDQVWGP